MPYKNFYYLITLIVISLNSTYSQVEIKEAFPNLAFEQVVDIQSPDDDTDRLFIVSQPGIIHTFDNDSSTEKSEIFLDINSKVLYGGEQGLLGLAFHPDFENNGYFYVDYTTGNPRRTVISRFSVSQSDINRADNESELVLLEVEQPYSNHNGGQIQFGPDGYLYVSFGDGGSAGDPANNAQNLSTLLGSIIRIDVDNAGQDINYSIPAGNPFNDNNQDYREEIYAYGLRNVWRFSFDNEGRLWAGDVGQNAWEEVHIVGKGDNCGWKIMEGNHCYSPSSGCEQTGLALPVWEYAHNSSGGRSITGGYVSYSNSAEELFGKYLCADFLSGRFWALTYTDTGVNAEVIAETSFMVSTFGTDSNNELYFADYKENGKIYKFAGTPVTSVKGFSPDHYILYRNYPNPFNPGTVISYRVEKPGNVKLEVFGITGEKISVLVNEYKNPGFYKEVFDAGKSNAGNLVSGIYLYKLTTGSFTATKKMLFLK